MGDMNIIVPIIPPSNGKTHFRKMSSTVLMVALKHPNSTLEIIPHKL
jgi:hypothetical protein